MDQEIKREFILINERLNFIASRVSKLLDELHNLKNDIKEWQNKDVIP